ncbi:CRISPR-associated protein Cas4 [Mesoaciditoga lauensis]|uniref:CRISPR-associated protein Cas4 n=1 Tax=Mesoaciditoga lauensis TaxID=1495039 RepID=UPI0005604D55|nr:CRISPR-associated protein Cas4 [Mesoaciditoga lauensis]
MNEDIITGYAVLAYSVCKREAWLVLRRFVPERDNSYIELGRFLHQNSYSKKGTKEIELPGARVDVIWEEGICTIVGEIKKSSHSVKGARIQLLYYLKILKDLGVEAKGQIMIPKERKKIDVELNSETLKEIEKIIKGVKELEKLEIPPKPEWKPWCAKCGFSDFCWAGEE